MMSTRSVDPQRMHAVSERGFLGVSALLFVASMAATLAWCTSMSGMGGMPMPGGWTLSMAWMPMCGQTWLGTATSFLGMWIVMMVAMMLPSLMPMLRGYRQAMRTVGGAPLGGLTLLVGVGYFLVWSAIGAVVFAAGAALVALEMAWPTLARAVPMAAGAIVLVAGGLESTAWKARALARCRKAHGPCEALHARAGMAWRHGVRLGFDCARACAGLTAILLVAGVMNLSAMVLITAAITLERLVPAGERVARAIGAVAVGAGLLLMARAVVYG